MLRSKDLESVGSAASLAHARVLVVGAGVAGCSAGAVLADAGIPVLLLSSALDAVGLPGYGPVLRFPPGKTSPDEALEFLPSWYLRAWTDGAFVPEGVDGALLVDRRIVAINTKWVLENHPLVELRQGHAVAVRVGHGGTATSAVVETAFGEELQGAACVLAVGMALGGRVLLGEAQIPGGRYGEVASDALQADLAAGGVVFEGREVAVGPRVVLDDPVHLADLLGGRTARLEPLAFRLDGIPSASDGSVALLPPGLPPRPETDVGPPEVAVVVGPQPSSGGSAPTPATCSQRQAGLWPGVWPDGHATGEWYVDPELSDKVLGLPGVRSTRPGHRISAIVVAVGAGEHALPELPAVWVTGEAAGVWGYLDALRDGARVGRELARRLRARVTVRENGG